MGFEKGKVIVNSEEVFPNLQCYQSVIFYLFYLHVM